MQFIEIELDPQETALAEAGAMMYMEPGVRMDTLFGDGRDNQGGGFMGKLLGAGKRVLTGESLFMTAFTNQGGNKQRVAFGALFGGEGLFLATLSGPGRVWLQSLPLSRLADRIIASAPKAGGSRKGEGSVLGTLGGLLDGDNR